MKLMKYLVKGGEKKAQAGKEIKNLVEKNQRIVTLARKVEGQGVAVSHLATRKMTKKTMVIAKDGTAIIVDRYNS